MKKCDMNLAQKKGILLDKKLVMYGAGREGEHLIDFLTDAGISVSYVCDKNKRVFREYKVINMQELKETSLKEDLVIVISSVDYFDEIYNEILENNIMCNAVFRNEVLRAYIVNINMNMRIDDLELFKMPEILFDKKIVMCGADKAGESLMDYMQEVGVHVSYVCDSEKKAFRGYQVLNMQELIALSLTEELVIVIADKNFGDEVYSGIVGQNVNCDYIFSNAGMRRCIECNIQSNYFSTYSTNKFKTKRELFNEYIDTYSTEFLDKEMKQNIQSSDTPGILVFQPGKVASKTIYHALLMNNIPALHLHSIRSRISEGARARLSMHIKNGKSPLRIITLEREPIARRISLFFQYMEFNYVYDDYDVTNGSDILLNLQKFMNKETELQYGYYNWYDEIKELTGINIFDYPFDKEKGYSIIKAGNVEILVLKTEKIDTNEKIIKEFVGCSRFVFGKKENVVTQKQCKYLHQNVLDRVTIPKKFVDKYYRNNPRMDYFYTEQEKEQFLKKYKIAGEYDVES